MANMSYCRFQNTLQDLRVCEENMGSTVLSDAESRARRRLVKLCKRIVDGYGYFLDEETED